VELRQYLSVLRSRLWLILAATLLAGGAGFTMSSSSAEYQARSTLYLGAQSPDATGGDITSDRLAVLDRQALTFSKMIDSDPVASRALKLVDTTLKPADLVKHTDVSPEPATQLLYIEVQDKDPEMAKDLANALADTFVDAVQEFVPGDEVGSVSRLPAYVFERAQRPSSPEPTDQIRTTLLATVFGLIGGAALVFLLDYLDVSLRTAADVERRLELPVLGVIPELGGEDPFGDLVALPAPRRDRL
jgi:succinoglycan biosynthesis transport protein ExoP